MLNQLRDVFSSFQKHNVKYLVIGGIAAVLHGVYVVSRKDLIASKKAAGRDKDLEDVRLLQLPRA